jgi:superfamily I DNA and/or RNA helicase
VIANHIEQRDHLGGLVPGGDGAVNTVDAFQGSERDVIVVSPMCVLLLVLA